jgi:hypothetical protein
MWFKSVNHSVSSHAHRIAVSLGQIFLNSLMDLCCLARDVVLCLWTPESCFRTPLNAWVSVLEFCVMPLLVARLCLIQEVLNLLASRCRNI